MSLRMIYDLLKWYKKKQRGETKEESPPVDPEVAYRYLNDYSLKLGKIFKAGIATSPYLHLIDPDLRPEEKEFINMVVRKTGGGAPLAMRLAIKADVPKKIEFAQYFGPALEVIMFLNGIENEDEALRRPDLIKEAFKLARALAQGKPYIYRGIVIPPDYETAKKVIPVELYDVERLTMEDLEMWERWFEEFYRKHPELLEEAPKTEESALKAAEVVVRELKPPKAVNIILSKLEAVKEIAAWTGGVDIRLLKKILYDVQDRKKIVEEALGLVKEWERGNKDAFLEGFEHLKNMPESELETHKLAEDIERIRRKVASGELFPTDAANLFTALHTTYSLTESHLTSFLSKIEEHTIGEPRSLRIRPEHLEKYVIRPLKEKLERIRPIIRGKL